MLIEYLLDNHRVVNSKVLNVTVERPAHRCVEAIADVG